MAIARNAWRTLATTDGDTAAIYNLGVLFVAEDPGAARR
jgi:hypothetical protein